MNSKKLQNQLQQAGEALNSFDWQRAGEIYTAILKEHPNNAGALMGVAILFNRSGKHRDALELLQRIWLSMQKASNSEQNDVPAATKAEILAQTGLSLQLMQKEDQALQLYEAANKLYASPQLEKRIAALRNKTKQTAPIQKLVNQAQQQAAQGQTDQAIATWREVLSLNPDHDVALHGLGDLYRQRREFQLALPLIQQAIIMQPRMATYHNTLGMLFQQKGEFEKALIFHRRAIDIDPNYAAARCNLGVAFKNLNRLDDAVGEYQKALEISPDMPEVYNNLGNLFRLLGRYDDAKESLEFALQLRPGYPDAKQNLEALKSLVTSLPAGKTKGSKPTSISHAKTRPVKPAAKPKAGLKAKPKPKAVGKPAVKSKAKAAKKPKPAARKKNKKRR